ncbi:hypothetical protein NBE98_12910 [Clostridium swellfunianum]|uniref:hypothetical protein n=1 Tax=Clostridium swellfunianum TaxID=1367462 RepID=UPI00202F4EAD|nr:hypothetical protein [Clostridium swellfunianum]MCM0649272.1 hypothetical protein [Clostridium swellfunianum]
MENCLNTTEIYYKDLEEYKIDINSTIESMLKTNERLVFALVAEKSGVTNFVVRKYPELRNYILQQLVYYKEVQVINQKIDRAVNNLVKANKTITFLAIVNKCKFSPDILYKNTYIKDKIRLVLSNRT